MAIDEERYNRWRKELNALLDDLSPSERIQQLEARIFDFLARRDIDPENRPRIQRLLSGIVDEELQPVIENVFERYAETIELANRLYADELGVDVSRDWDRIRAIENATAQEWGSYKEKTLQNLTTAVREGLVANDTTDELEERIRDVATGKAERYAETIANTQVSTYGRSLKVEQARKAGVKHFEYVGVVRNVTRPFCRAHAGTTHTLQQIRRLRNGNREPVLINAGGWNCVHGWEPDPFAEEPSDGSFAEPDAGVRVRVTQEGLNRYQRAKELNRQADD
jgi:hypothetical protein